MKKKLTKGITLAMVWGLILVGLPSLGAQEVIQEEVEAAKSNVSSRIRNRASSKAAAGTRKVLNLLPGGRAIGDFFWGSEAEQALEVQKEILATNQDTLSQIRTMAQDALKVKRKIEEIDRLRRNSVRLGQDFSKMSYSKMVLALGDRVLGISCNPSDYIPNTEYTRKLKRNLRINYSREKRLFQGSQGFLKSSRKALSFKDKSYRNHQAFQKKLVQATAYNRHVEEYAASRNFSLIQEHEELADSLLKSNEEIENLIRHEKAYMSPAQVVHMKHIINKNIAQALAHKVKANKLLQEGSQDSDSDKEKLAALEEHVLTQELIGQELKALQNREQPSWRGGSQKGIKKTSKNSHQPLTSSRRFK